MSANSSGSGRTGGGASPQETKPSTSGTSKRDAEGARAEDGVSSSMHSRPNDPTKYTKEPHDEKSQLSGQTTSLLKSPERGYSKSLNETRTDAEGARAEGGVSFSMHTRQSARQTGNGKDGRTNPVTDSQLPRSSSGPEFLHIQLNKEEETEGCEKFEISLYSPTGKIMKYIVQITCKREDFFRLKFMFNNGNTIKDLANMLLEVNYSLKSGTQEINLDSKSFGKTPQKIQDEIEGVINTLLNLNNILVLCTPVSNVDEILVEECQRDNPDCREGNVVMHLDDLYLWIVGQDEEKLEKLRKIVTPTNFIPKGDASTHHKVVTSQPEPVKDFAGLQKGKTFIMKTSTGKSFGDSSEKDTMKSGLELDKSQRVKTESTLPDTNDKEMICKHGVFFVLDPGRKLKEEEWGLEIECASPEFYKLLFSFSNEKLTSIAKTEFHKMNISLSEIFSQHLGRTCPCIKPCDQRKPDHFMLKAVVSVCYELLPLVHLSKLTIHPDRNFEQIKTFCFSRHDAFKNGTVQLFYNEDKCDEAWVAVEDNVQDLGDAVLKDLLNDEKVIKVTKELKKYDLSGCFAQCAALDEMDAKFLNLIKERYKDVNVSSDGKWAVCFGQEEIYEDLFKNMREDILALRKVKRSFTMSPSLTHLFTFKEAVDFINQTVHAKHSEPIFWTVRNQPGKNNLLEVYALDNSNAQCALQVILGCFREREIDKAQLQTQAFELPVLNGDKFRGKTVHFEMPNKVVKISGTEDVLDEYIDLLLNESNRLKKPVCKTVQVNSSRILSFCETHYQDHFRKWKECVKIEAIFGTNGTCGYTIKGHDQNSEKIVEIANELKKIVSDVQEIWFKEEEENIIDMSRNAEFRKQRCEIEKEWDVDTFLEGVPGQDWSVVDGFEWRFENGPSLTLLILKSALPVETDVVLKPYRKDNIPGKQQRNIQNPLSRDWHTFEFEAECGDIGKAKESLRKTLKSTLLLDVKGNHFQTLVFPVEQKILENVGWSINHYLKQILVVLNEDFISEPWSFYFLCGNTDELKICADILDTNFKKDISKTDVRIKSFPIQENVNPSITIEVRQGSLVQTKADVIVNTTSKDLRSLKNGHVSKSILDAAGIELSKECRKKYPNGIEYCKVAVTPSFQLKHCKQIYHGGIPFFKESLTPLKVFVWNCLVQATKDKMQSIAFPAIGTGNLKYPKEDVAETMIHTVHEFGDECPTSLQSVVFVIFDDETLQEFRERSKAKQTAASNTKTPSISDTKVKITIVGSSDRAEAASNCLHDFIKEFKKKKEDGNITKQDKAIQPSTSKENTASEKSITDREATFPTELPNERDNVSINGGCLRLILLKKASEADSSLNMSECRKHLNGFKYKKIICPFGNGYSALVKFETQKDVDQVLSNLESANYAFKKLPEQAIHNVKAKLSKQMIQVLKIKDVTEEEIENASGASLDKIEWFITGHLLEIKQAEEFLKQIMSGGTEPRTLRDPTSLPNKIPEADTTDVYEKRNMHCSISEWGAIGYFYQDVTSKLYHKLDEDGLRCRVIGKPEAIDEFSHTLGSIFKVTFNNIDKVIYEKAAKFTEIYCHFLEEQSTLEVFAKSSEKIDFIKASITNFKYQGSRRVENFDKQKSEFKTDKPIKTADNETVENEVQLTMLADDFDTVCHFYKEFAGKFKRMDEGDNITLAGTKNLAKELQIAKKDIDDNFFNEVIVVDVKGISKVYDVYAQVTETLGNIHVRIRKSRSNCIVLFTGQNKQEVLKMKCLFEDELEKKDRTSGKKSEGKKMHFSSSQRDCLLFQRGKFKVFSVEKDIFQVYAAAVVCPATLCVGNHIKEKAGLPKNIINERADATSITGAQNLDTCTVLIHTNIPRWSDYEGIENPCENCITDISFVVERCLSVVTNYSSVAFPEFISDKNSQLPAIVCCMGFVRGVHLYLNDHPTSNLEIYYADSDPFTLNLLKRSFKQDVNWEYIADDEHSIFFIHCKFQVHVKKADVFKSTACAIAASQDPDMKNERFIAKHLYQMNDTKYKLELIGRKLFKYPIITTAPVQCGYVKVIHFVSPNWRNMKNKRDEQLKKHSESVRTLLDYAKKECPSVVIPLSGGHFTDWETRKEIAKSTATVVAKWCKENAKNSQKLEFIYFMHDDSRYIKETIECCRQHLCQKDQLIVVPPTYSTAV